MIILTKAAVKCAAFLRSNPQVRFTAILKKLPP